MILTSNSTSYLNVTGEGTSPVEKLSVTCSGPGPDGLGTGDLAPTPPTFSGSKEDGFLERGALIGEPSSSMKDLIASVGSWP